jgi:CheY-like chemotaxis protein
MIKKILLIEDTVDVLENLAELLRMEGYEIIPALNGQEAFDKLYIYTPDLIITDLRMPTMDGFTFLEKIKLLPDLKSIPVLIFSANATPENEKRCLQLGAVGFLKKPCNTEFLLESIQAVFASR